MAETQENLHAGTSAQPFRIDQKLHQILYKSETRPALEPKPEEVLPEPVYPQHPNPVAMTQTGVSEVEREENLEDLGRALLQIALALAANCVRSFLTYLPNGNAIWIVTIAGHTTMRSRE